MNIFDNLNSETATTSSLIDASDRTLDPYSLVPTLLNKREPEAALNSLELSGKNHVNTDGIDTSDRGLFTSRSYPSQFDVSEAEQSAGGDLITGGDTGENQPVQAAIQTAEDLLNKFAVEPDFITKMQTAFGNGFDARKTGFFADSWRNGELGRFPGIEVRSQFDLAGANGAFAAATNTIYLAQEFVEKNSGDVKALASVFLEEYGHFIDSQINTTDAAGDEGEIFSDLIQGKQLTLPQLLALQAEDDREVVTLDGQTVLIEQANSNIQVSINAPSGTRPNRIGEVTVTYTNVGQTDTAAPLLTLSATNALLLSPSGNTDRVQFLGINNQGAAGILQPGASGSFKLQFLATGEVGNDINFSASIAQENALIDWNAIKNDARPETVPADAWDVIWNNFTSSVANTAGQYQAVLAENATRLSQLGDYSNDVSRLLAFELEQAGNYGSIPQRYTIGSLGRGWTFPFEISVTTDSDGNAIVQTSGILRFFTKQPGGGYLSQPGDEATLTQVGDTFQLREQGGTLVTFRPDGKLDFIEDTNSNRVTANYTENQLTSINSTNGDSLTFSYNAQGRISQIVDRAGRITTYSYDPTGELLLGITDPAGTTSYTYDVGNVLRSVNFPDGTQTLYEYDAQGRVIKQSLNGGAEAITFEYDSAGGVTVIDATGTRTTLLLNDLGQIGLAQDTFGRTSQFRYNADGNLIQQIAPGNITSTFTYDDRGNLLNQVDPLRNQVNFTYNPTFDQVQSVTDQRGNVTTYKYDEKGNLVAIEYVPSRTEQLNYERGSLIGSFNNLPVGRLDGIQNNNGTNPVVSYYDNNGNLVTTNVIHNVPAIDEQFSYDARGNLIKYINRREQAIEYIYDDRDRLIRQINPDGSQINFTYDERDNLIAATDAKGTITQEFDSADRLTKITYLNGRFLQYTYDAGGRRIRMVDQDGFAVNYAYDAVGRLTGLTDGNGQRIVAYTYDNVGRLSREDNGNGTYTTYGYDAVGQLLNIVNFSPSGAINSRFDYTYDNLGRRTSMTTLEGTFQYGYDANGQLTSVTLPNGRIIQYQYDAAGNRIAVNDNGAGTSYNTNNLNQYTTVGGATYTYDTDGNLIAKTEGGKSWTYSYDAENRLVSAVTPEGSWSYEYDAFGNRIASTQNGQRTEYLLDPSGFGNVVGEYSNGSLVARYTHGLGLESRVDATNATAYYDFDAIGSTAGLTAGNGSYVNRYSYLPFGEDLNKVEAVSNPFEFVGQFGVMDEGNDLDFMRARYYDSSVGRFTTVDPLGLGGGNSNLYTYTFNASTNTIDPQGTNPLLVAIGAGAVIGGVSNAVVYSTYAIGTNSFSLRGLGGAALSGALFGGATGAVATYAAAGTIGAAAATGLNALAGGVSNTIGYLVENAGTSNFKGSDLAASALTGAASGAFVPSLLGFKGKGAAGPFQQPLITFSKTVQANNKTGQALLKGLTTGNVVSVPVNEFLKNFLNKLENGFSNLTDALSKIFPFPPPAPENSATTFNDPRIVTFDKQYHDFQAAGEFTLVQSTSGDLKIQVRQEPVGNDPLTSNVADNTAVTTILGGKRIGIYKGQGLLIDGVRTEIPDLDSLAVGDGRIYREGNIYTIVYATGDQLVAKLQPSRVNINVYLTKEREGQITGLLGNFNNNPTDDLIKRDGTVLSQPVSISQLYSEYADSWRISQAESLFDYSPGQDTNSLTIRNFPPRRVTLRDLIESRPGDVQRAEQRIGNLIADPTIREATIIDYILTGFDETIIEDAIASQTPDSILAIAIPPRAFEDFSSTFVNTPVKINVVENDEGTLGVGLAIANFDATTTKGGNIKLDDNATPDNKSDDQLIYTPPANFTGIDTFNYTLTDGKETSTSKVTISVPAFNLSTLNGSNGFVLNGSNAGNFTGVSTSSIGDFNSDGFDDLIIGAFAADPNGNNAAGESYVLFGSKAGFPVNFNPANLNGSNGFIINGVDPNGFSGGAVSSAGDVNGDGIDDLAIGVFGATANGKNNAGKTYIVFGSKNPFPVRFKLSELNGNNGFFFNGNNEFDYVGLSISKLGDLNGDSLDDLLVNAPVPLNSSAGKNYIIYGRKGSFSPSLNTTDINGTNGFVINDTDGNSGSSVKGVGDINGDGMADLIIGTDAANPDNNTPGKIQVLFGSRKGFPAIVNRSELNGKNGFVIEGVEINTSTFVSGAGDINGDGLNDLIVGVADATANNNSAAGKTYIIFGKPAEFAPVVNLNQLNGSNGFVINGTEIEARSGISVDGAGDINGDGFDDMIIGASGASANGNNAAGKSYILFGSNQAFPANFNLAELNGNNGFIFNGATADDLTGTAVSGAGDINGDGLGDLIIGTPGSLFNNAPGKSYVVFGNTAFGGVYKPSSDPADLELVQTISNKTPYIGDEVTLKYTLTNKGKGVARRIKITDLLPPGVSFVSAATDQGIYDSNTGMWELGNIRENLSRTLDIVVKVEKTGYLVTTGQVTAVRETDPDSIPNNNNPAEDDQDSEEFGVAGGGGLTLVFDERYYLAQHSDVKAAVEKRKFKNGFSHFVRHGEKEDRDFRVLVFDESYYLAQNPDVKEAVEKRKFRSGLRHFIEWGQFEQQRKPNSFDPTAKRLQFDEDYYLQQNSDVEKAVEKRNFRTGFAHFIEWGQIEGRKPSLTGVNLLPG